VASETQLLNTPSLGLYEEQKTSCDVLLVLIASREGLNICVFIMIVVFREKRESGPAQGFISSQHAAAMASRTDGDVIGHVSEWKGVSSCLALKALQRICKALNEC
jgi:hypothetical protein